MSSEIQDIRLENVSKIYPGDVCAVDSIDLTIRDGEFMILLGPSGCGKSTTLRMIAGLEGMTSGDLFIGERRMNLVDPRDRNLAIVFQNYALFPHMTVRGNLSFGMKIRGHAAAAIGEKVKETAALLGLDDLLDRKPGALSGGQRQRVALGRALMRDPAAYLLDEPLSNLDAKLRTAMRTELIKLHRRLGRTIVHVTHDQVEAMTMGERICIMNQGKIVQTGPPMEVYRNPADTFVAGFLASPPMNLLPARVDTVDGGLEVVAGPLRLPIADQDQAGYASHTGREVTLGIRPEDFSTEQSNGTTTIAVAVEVVAIEALGPEVILIGALPNSGLPEIAVRMPRDFEASVGSHQRLFLDPASFHLFDNTTTKALPRAPRHQNGRALSHARSSTP
ncbi:MAG: ABC transporter ATP-binding protein [Geminicoccales bacterium]